MIFAKDKNYHAENGNAGRPASGRLTACAQTFLALLVIFVSAHSSSAARNCLDGSSSSIPSLEKRHPFTPPITHRLKTSFVSIDERSDYSWFAADKAQDAIWLADRVLVGKVLKSFDSDDPPDSFLVLPLRI
jgi:hypothetical protein